MKLMLNLVMLLMMVVGAGEALSAERKPSYDCVPVKKQQVKNKKTKKRSLASREKKSKVVYAHFNVELCGE